VSRINVDLPTPTQPGTYLWAHSLGVEIITVVRIPEHYEYGVHWNEYLAVPAMRCRSVEKLQGTFSKPLFISNDHIKEIDV
jgi:hypothetical protein